MTNPLRSTFKAFKAVGKLVSLNRVIWARKDSLKPESRRRLQFILHLGDLLDLILGRM